ncbi:hypothetical protein YYG_05129 [Plasmodium vinckei petteri]|uniref:Erythrocyte membrane antigen 1 n=1 Tax=Plasmodium vinckei petteri TaxID=138298 RepID=W7ALM2_PLAVN|nr:hypothetical protein YYG_05129 [Plasmodium vinckei petteri]
MFGFRFPFCIKKTKKSHKTTDEPDKIKDDYDPDIPNIKFIDEFSPKIIEIYKGQTDGIIIDKVTGFSRRENNSSVSGWYIRPYEEDYEDMIKANFILYREYYERKQQNAHKQHRGPPPKLSTTNEEISSTLPKDDADALNGDEELDVEVASYLGDGENDGEGEENENEDDAEE